MTIYVCGPCHVHFSINDDTPEYCPVCGGEDIEEYEWDAEDRRSWYEG